MELTKLETNRLTELETVVAKGMETFIAVGQALKEIRESRLYRQEHTTFEAYCKDKWGWSKSHSNRLIDAVNIVEVLTPIGAKPLTESQARELGKIKDPEERNQVWAEVVDTHEPEKITAKVIRETSKVHGFITASTQQPDRGVAGLRLMAAKVNSRAKRI